MDQTDVLTRQPLDHLTRLEQAAVAVFALGVVVFVATGVPLGDWLLHLL